MYIYVYVYIESSLKVQTEKRNQNNNEMKVHICTISPYKTLSNSELTLQHLSWVEDSFQAFFLIFQTFCFNLHQVILILQHPTFRSYTIALTFSCNISFKSFKFTVPSVITE